MIWRDIEVVNSDTSEVRLRLYDALERPLDLTNKTARMQVSVQAQNFEYTMAIRGNEAAVEFTIVTSSYATGRYSIYIEDDDSGLHWVAAQGTFNVLDPMVP